MEKAAAPIVVVIAVTVTGYYLLQEPAIWRLFGWAVAILIGFGIFLWFCMSVIPELKRNRQYNAAPLDGPMKINITTTQIGSKFRMHIDVKMSKNDMLDLQNSGLMSHSLFSYQYKDVETHFRNAHLFNTTHVDFADIQDVSRAKSELIEGLHALRSRLDQQKEHNRAQRFGGEKEQLEI